MMNQARLQIRLLGPFHVTLDGQPITGFHSKKVRALLAYLVMEADKPISRQDLQQLFWESSDPKIARQQLRKTLSNLRTLLSPLDLLAIDRQTVQINPSFFDLWCDVFAFEKTEERQTAYELYRGDFLVGLEIADSPLFTSWQEARRHRYRQQLTQYHPTNLPRRITSLIGRTEEIQQVSRKLLAPDIPIVTLVGEGGIGKTRLSLAVAESLRRHFVDGVWFVSLGNVTPSERYLDKSTNNQERSRNTLYEDAIALAIGKVLHYSFYSLARPTDQLSTYLQKKQMLLVLDNFEHLIEGVGFLVKLVAEIHGLSLLVTSREVLNLQMEYLFGVPGLAVPKPDTEWVQIQSEFAQRQRFLETYTGIQLWLERADQILPNGFELDAENLEAVIQVCQVVDGLPLGIELAAALLPKCTVAEIADDLTQAVGVLASTETSNVLDILQTSQHDVVARHRSIRTVFTYSWKLLSPTEQMTFAQCSVFRGSFTQEAGLTVTNTTDETLVALCRKSLLRRVAYIDDELRYEMHELARQFAAERLAEIEAAKRFSMSLNIHFRHSQYYLGFVAQREVALRDGQSKEPLNELRQELGNIRYAWSWAATYAQVSLLETSHMGLWRFYHTIGLCHEGERVFHQAILALEQVVTQMDEGKEPTTSDAQPILRTDIEQVISNLYLRRAFLLEQVSLFEESLEAAYEALKRSQDEEQKAQCRLWCGMIQSRLGNFSEAESLLNRSLGTAVHLEDPLIATRARYTQGIVLFHQGRYDEASQIYSSLLTQSHQLRNQRGQILSLSNLGAIADRQGTYSIAQSYYDHALTIAKQLDDHWNMTNQYFQLGVTCFHMGDYQQAQWFYSQALTISTEIQALQLEGWVRARQGMLFLQTGETTKALQSCEQGMSISEQCNDPLMLGDTLTYLGHVLVGQEAWADATAVYTRALEIRQRLGQAHLCMDIYADLAWIALATNKPTQSLLYVDPILQYFNQNPTFYSVDQPGHVLWICCQCLKTVGQLAANDLVSRAYQLISQRASQIENASLQRCFLQNIQANREIIRLYKNL